MSAQRNNLLKRCPCTDTKWAKCPHPWHLAMRHDGQRYAVSLDKYAKRRGLDLVRQRGDAETLAARITKEIETGTYVPKPTPAAPAAAETPAPVHDGLTVDQAWPLYVAAALAGLESVKAEEGRYRLLAAVDMPDLGRFGALPLAAVTETHIETVYGFITRGKSEHTKHQYRRNLRRLFKWAVRKKHLPVNPITEDTVLRAGKGNMRTRRVRPDEEVALLTATEAAGHDAGRRLAALIVAALDVCARVGELLAVRWCDILWDEGVHGRLLVRAVERGARKNGKGRRIPLTPRLLVLLRQLQALHPPGKPWAGRDYVFGNELGERLKKIRKSWVTCVLRAHGLVPGWTGTKIDKATREAFKAIDLHFHDLRHEGALRWLEAGFTLPTIAQLLGHSNLNTLRVYLGVTQEDALAEAERLSGAGDGPRGSKPAAKQPTGHLRVVARREGTERQVTG